MDEIYARLKDGNVVEYPVFKLHINNRAHPVSWYTRCIFDEKPVKKPFYSYIEKLKVVTDQDTNISKVYVSYIEVPLSLNELLRIANRNTTALMQMPGEEETAVSIADIPQDLLYRILFLADQYIQDKLDEFAATRQYKDVTSLCSYKDSTRPSYASDAARGIVVRDKTWIATEVYMGSVLTGVTPVPKSTADIDAILTDLTWE